MLKKIIYFVVLSIMLIPIFGCDKARTQRIAFHNMYFDLLILDKSYHNVAPGDLISNLVGDNLDYAYVESGRLNSGFLNNLLISRTALPKTATLTDFFDNNLNMIKTTTIVYTEDSTDEEVFDCMGVDVVATLHSFTVQNSVASDNLLYFRQYFFIYKSYGYVVSFVSENEAESNKFSSSIVKLKCSK